MRLIDADAAYKAACEGADNWDGAYSPYRYDRIREEMDKVPTFSPWHRVEEPPLKPGCYLTASPFFHGYDYSWLYRLARWTEHGLMDFVQDAEKESGWYIWNNSQDRDTEIEPMYWMPIEPPKEDA